MSRIDEIKAQYEEQKRYGSSGFMMRMDDIGYLLSEIDRAMAERDSIKLSNDGLCISHDNLYARLREAIAHANKAERERDTYKKELYHLEHMISNERDENGKQEHSIGVTVAIKRARELLKGE